MIYEIITSFSWWFPLVAGYLLVGGVKALKTRAMWLPLAYVIPLFLLLLQVPLFMSLSGDIAMLLIVSCMVGIGVGGTILRLNIKQGLDRLCFVVGGEYVTLLLVAMMVSIKVATTVVPVMYPETAWMARIISALAGTFVPGIFLGRALFLTAHLKQGGKK